MAILRIVADLETPDPKATADWYAALFGMEVLMDQGFIVTLGAGGTAPVQLSLASEGGSGTPVPHLSIEVDDIDDTHARAMMLKLEEVYPMTLEPWGVRRFFLRDPQGRILNILSHAD